MANQHELWENDAEARVLENRTKGLWNPDYFENIILPLLNLNVGDRVLDVGSGNGALTLLLARLLPDVHFTGVDITPTLVEQASKHAKKLNIENAVFRQGNAHELSFQDEYFDATVCQTV